MIADHVDSSCDAAGGQSWLQSQGEMVNAWTDMYAACKAYAACNTAPSYYNNLAYQAEGEPGQAEPTVDNNGKGFFERAIYCSNHNFNDSALTSFAAKNAGSLAGLPHFGFLWDSTGANDPVIFPTQTSVLDGLDADLGGSYAMC